MAQSAKIIDLGRSYLPIDPVSLTQNDGLTQGEDAPEKTVPVIPYEGWNFMPSAQGYKSYFGTQELDIDNVPSPCDELLIIQNAGFANIIVALCSDGIYTKDGKSQGSWATAATVTPESNENIHYTWSYCIIANVLYMYRQHSPVVHVISGYNQLADDGSIEHLAYAIYEDTPTFLNMAGQIGIFKAGGRLGFWDAEDSISWSAYEDPMDHTPAITTQANSAKFKDVIGRITVIHQHGTGFIIYSTKSIVNVKKQIGNVFGWSPDVVSNASGVAYPKQVAVANPDSVHFAWTQNSIIKIADGQPEQIITELFDYLIKSKSPVYLRVLGGRYLFLEVAEASLLYGSISTTVGNMTSFGITVATEGQEAAFNAMVDALWNNEDDNGELLITETKQSDMNGAILAMESDCSTYLRPANADLTIGQNYHTKWTTEIVPFIGPLSGEDTAFAEGLSAIDWSNPSTEIDLTSLLEATLPGPGMFFYNTLADPDFPTAPLSLSEDTYFTGGTLEYERSLTRMNNNPWADKDDCQLNLNQADPDNQDFTGFFAAANVIWQRDFALLQELADQTEARINGGDWPQSTGNAAIQSTSGANTVLYIAYDEVSQSWFKQANGISQTAQVTVGSQANRLETSRDFIPKVLADVEYFATAKSDPANLNSTGVAAARQRINILEQFSIVKYLSFDVALMKWEIFQYTGADLVTAQRLSTVDQFSSKEAALAYLHINKWDGAAFTARSTGDTYTDTSYAMNVIAGLDISLLGVDGTGTDGYNYVIAPAGTCDTSYSATVERVSRYVGSDQFFYTALIRPTEYSTWNGVGFTFAGNTIVGIPGYSERFITDDTYRASGTMGRIFNPAFKGTTTFAGQPFLYIDSSDVEWGPLNTVNRPDFPDGPFLMQDGSPEPIYPTFAGAFVYDLQYKKWGKLLKAYKKLFDFSPINVDTAGQIPFTRFGVAGAILDEYNKIRVFDANPEDSFISYGKFALFRLGVTALQEVTVQFAIQSSGSIETQTSLDGKNTEIGLAKSVLFDNELTVTLYPKVAGKWHNIVIRGQYDISYIQINGYRLGRR